MNWLMYSGLAVAAVSAVAIVVMKINDWNANRRRASMFRLFFREAMLDLVRDQTRSHWPTPAEVISLAGVRYREWLGGQTGRHRAEHARTALTPMRELGEAGPMLPVPERQQQQQRALTA